VPVSACSESDFLLRFREFTFELFALFKERGKPIRDIGWVNAKKVGGLPKRRFLRRKMGARCIRGQRLDAPYAGCDGAFLDDLNESDFAGRARMGAPAQLD
jgi:hypothetical protein